MSIDKRIKLKAGKSYKIAIPSSNKQIIWIDYVLENKKYTHWSDTLIIYRYYNKKYGWVYKTECYYTLAILNNWDYSKEELF
jgi:hypothetical protein